MWLAVQSGVDAGTVVEVTGHEFVIGRDESADLTLRDPKVSRRHALVEPLPDGRVAVRDLGSSNGTRVDGERIDEAFLAGDHDQVQIGGTLLILTQAQPEAGEQTLREIEPVPQGPSTISRAALALSRALRLQRSARRMTAVGVSTLVVAPALAVLLAAGVMSGGGRSAAEVVDSVQSATVLIQAERSGQPAGTGSGWVLDARQGLIVTNAHVVNAGTRMRVGVDGKLRSASIVAVAPCEDLAVLKVADRTGLETMPLGTQADLREGQSVVAVGFPANASLSAQLTSTVGVVSVAKTEYREPALDVPAYTDVVQTDAAINPGNSGGPLVRVSDGKLVGVNAATRTQGADSRVVQGQGYAIGVDRVKQLLPALRHGRSIGWSGMLLGYPDATERGAVAGIRVDGVVSGSPAAKAGFGRSALTIVGVNGTGIQSTLQSYCDAVKGVTSGSTAVFTVAGGGRSTHTRNIRVRME